MVDKLPEVPYPGIVPWEDIRKKVNEIIDDSGSVDWSDVENRPTGITIERGKEWLDDPYELYTISPTADANRGMPVDMSFTGSVVGNKHAIMYCGGSTSGDILTMTFLGSDGDTFEVVTDLSASQKTYTIDGDSVSYYNTFVITYTAQFTYGARINYGG